MNTTEIISNMYCLLTWCILLSIAVAYLIYVLHGKNKDLEAFERDFNLYKNDIRVIKSDITDYSNRFINHLEMINSIRCKLEPLYTLKELAELINEQKTKEDAKLKKQKVSNYMKIAHNLMDLIIDYKAKRKNFNKGGCIL